MYSKPVLICQPSEDKMTAAYYTKKVYDRLGSKQKEYKSFNGAHFPIEKSTYKEWANVVDSFIKRYGF